MGLRLTLGRVYVSEAPLGLVTLGRFAFTAYLTSRSLKLPLDYCPRGEVSRCPAVAVNKKIEPAGANHRPAGYRSKEIHGLNLNFLYLTRRRATADC
jgi:hypothetical protein